MRGISEIITLILMLLIVVALIGTTWAWLSGDIFGSLTGNAQDTVDASTSSMGTNFKIESAKNITPSDVTVTIRNIGNAAINISKMGFYVGGDMASNTVSNPLLYRGGTSTFNISSLTNPKGKKLMIVSENGIEVTTTIT